MNVRVSIVVPAYNNADYIEETMHSIIGQTWTDLEIIVADHGSSDSTWEKLQQFTADPRVTLLTTEPGGGASRNWNRVSRAATAPFIKLVCADDIIEPTMIERQLALFDYGVVMVGTSRHIVDAESKTIISNRGLGRLDGRRTGDYAIRTTVRSGTNPFGEPACVMMRRDVLEAVGHWAEGEEYLIDEATYVKVLEHGDFVGLRIPLASFRINAGQWSVRLVHEQAKQAAEFHRALRERRPELISRSDVTLGNTKARIFAFGRRMIYALFGRRLGNAGFAG